LPGEKKRSLKNNGTGRRNSTFSRITNHKIQTHRLQICAKQNHSSRKTEERASERERERGTELLLEKNHTASPEYLAIFIGKKTHISPYSLLTILI
jgi:hypothetical protein